MASIDFGPKCFPDGIVRGLGVLLYVSLFDSSIDATSTDVINSVTTIILAMTLAPRIMKIDNICIRVLRSTVGSDLRAISAKTAFPKAFLRPKC